MNRKIFAFLALLPLAAIAQPGEIPKSTLDDLSRDLAQLQKAVLDAQAKQQIVEAKATNGFKYPDMVTLIAPTSLRVGATEKSPALVKASKGDSFPIVEHVGDWYSVKLDKPINGVKAGWLPAAATIPTAQPVSAQSTSLADQIFSELTGQAARFRQSYQNNPYISVTGFTVNVLPPSVAINFEFKK